MSATFPQPLQSWPTLASRPLGDFRIFSLRADRRRSPRNGHEQDFVIIEARPWVNVIALTADHQAILVEQFRHGTGTLELEVPGGVLDAHDLDPVAAGVRELREETGYTGERAQIIGTVWANPAIQNNACHTVLVENCCLTHELKLDTGEDLVTRLVPTTELPRHVTTGRIRHSLVVVALYHFELWRKGPGSAASKAH